MNIIEKKTPLENWEIINRHHYSKGHSYFVLLGDFRRIIGKGRTPEDAFNDLPHPEGVQLQICPCTRYLFEFLTLLESGEYQDSGWGIRHDGVADLV
jgi:hypothetical protein